ncbi:MAG: hypothetical protein AB1761_11280 [Pseudomonadota bacterium]
MNKKTNEHQRDETAALLGERHVTHRRRAKTRIRGNVGFGAAR